MRCWTRKQDSDGIAPASSRSHRVPQQLLLAFLSHPFPSQIRNRRTFIMQVVVGDGGPSYPTTTTVA